MVLQGTAVGRSLAMRSMAKRFGMLVCLAGGATAGLLLSQPAAAENELRVGAMLELPFGGSQHDSFVHFSSTRIGAKVQYADVDDIIKRNEQDIDRVYQDGVLVSSQVRSAGVVTEGDGDKVIGGEFYLLVAPFTGKWTISGGLNAFAGNNDFQGAAGFGFDPSFGGYMEIAALMPYSEAGLRLNFTYVDYFAGATSLSGFSSKTVWKQDVVRYHDTFNTTPVDPAPVEEGGEPEAQPEG